MMRAATTLLIRTAALALPVTLTGCVMGVGTSTVGIWRPKRVVDTDVCIRNAGGGCKTIRQVAHDVPARSFGGGLIAWANPGYAHVSGVAGGADRLALDNHIEYLRGRSGLAGGVRVGANLATTLGGRHGLLLTVPVTAVVHWGYPRFSLYGGAGYTPYAVNRADAANGTTTSTQLRGFNFMAGGRVVLRTAHSYRLSVSVDVFRQYLGGPIDTSVTGAFGVHL